MDYPKDGPESKAVSVCVRVFTGGHILGYFLRSYMVA